MLKFIRRACNRRLREIDRRILFPMIADKAVTLEQCLAAIRKHIESDPCWHDEDGKAQIEWRITEPHWHEAQP